ncbi:MAG: hypothetical protein N3F64_02360 [Nitrososphaeria archaeon]|nr:hypothetical protein [Nitrososphaeria archaeon]
MYNLLDKVSSMIVVIIFSLACINNLYLYNVEDYAIKYYNKVMAYQVVDRLLEEFGATRLFYEVEKGIVCRLLERFLIENKIFDSTLIIIEFRGSRYVVGGGSSLGSFAELVLCKKDCRMVLKVWFMKK